MNGNIFETHRKKKVNSTKRKLTWTKKKKKRNGLDKKIRSGLDKYFLLITSDRSIKY